jgi:methylmalonyl-CoA mutase N-terminal domain/subunit
MTRGKDINHEKQRWEKEKLEPLEDKNPPRKQVFKTVSGSEIDNLYLPDPSFDYLEKLSFPGEYPFARGVMPNTYRGRLWTMRQYSGFGTARESNERYRYMLDHGQTGLSVAFDLPTQIGYDSDHPLAHGEVGKVGVAICSLKDMDVLFRGIPLDKVSTSMTINATAAILLSLYVAVAAEQGVPASQLNGTIQNDILKEYIARGTYIYPPRQSMRLVTDIFKFCRRQMPVWNTISISGYHIREAGATAVQEVTFTLANAIEYVSAAIDAGLQVDEFAPRLAFFFGCHNSFFEEIAKFRAARRLWARIMKERFSAKEPRSMMLRFHTQTAGCTLTAQQPENNVVRVTLQALAAVLGGTQSLHTNSRDEALALPTAESAKIALRTQQIIAFESGVADTVDPIGGSYFVESLTDRIEEEVWEYLKKIDAMGGAVVAIENHVFQAEIAKSAYEYQKQVESEQEKIVGVNCFQDEDSETHLDILKVNREIEIRQTEELRKFRSTRDADAVRRSLDSIRTAAKGTDELIPPILQAVQIGVTLGEISNALRDVFGEYKSDGT